jgi:predicted PurR-regulated permease PerM
MKSESFQRGFLLILVVAVTLVFAWMIRSFLVTLLLAALFSSLARPLYLRFLDYTRGRRHAAAGAAILVFVLLIILPALGFVGVVANEAVNVTQNVAPWVQEKIGNKAELERSLHRLPGFKYVTPYSEQIVNGVGDAVSGLGNTMFKAASALTAGTLVFFVNFAIMLYAMFFFFIDGPAILDKMLYYLPLHSRDERKLLNGIRSTARATIKGIVVIGAIQGCLAGLAFWAAGIPSPLFWGTVMAVLSVVPNVGSALIWVPACIYLFIKGDTTAATLVFLWCAVVVGSADNVLRPILVGKDTQMPELLVLLSTLGGLTMFGLEGFILGPGLALIFLTIWDIYGAVFKDVLPKAGDLS